MASIEDEFRWHADKWIAETRHMSSIHRMIEHPSYQRIIEMGQPAVPLLLRELKERPNFWFAALSAVTGENIGEALGFDAARRAWIEWGLVK